MGVCVPAIGQGGGHTFIFYKHTLLSSDFLSPLL